MEGRKGERSGEAEMFYILIEVVVAGVHICKNRAVQGMGVLLK